MISQRYHESFPSFSYGFDSRYPLHLQIFLCDFETGSAGQRYTALLVAVNPTPTP